MAIQPLGKRVLLKRVEAETVSAGGILLVESAQEKPQEAIVVSLGTGGKEEDGSDFVFSVKKDDRVLITKYGGTEVKVNDVDHLLMSESDILGIVS